MIKKRWFIISKDLKKNIVSKIKVIIQARLGSRRLREKVLLPICGVPLVVLCWKRIKDKMFNLEVAIPKDKADDKLAKILKKNNIKFFRGEKNNVLDRFRSATSTMKPDELIIRATADNPLVDKYFIKKLILAYKKNEFDYISGHDNVKNCPFGLQVEIFKVKHLREKIKKNNYNLEHVTPSIRRKYLSKKKIKIKNLNYSQKKRITLDTKLDYKKIIKMFSYSKNNIKIKYLNILKASNKKI